MKMRLKLKFDPPKGVNSYNSKIDYVQEIIYIVTMFQSLLQSIIDYLHSNPQSAGFIVYLIACGEALAVVGTLIPGSVTLTAAGILIGSRVIPVISTFIWAIAGAITGDLLSYWAGRYYKDRIHKMWPFTRYPHWLKNGEIFFAKHGGKSIIIGRVCGPIRCFVPLIAGTLKMGYVRFLLFAVPSAAAWAMLYLLPGVLIGAISLELPRGLAFAFIAVVLGLILLLVLISWGTHYFFIYLGKKVDHQIKKLWQFLQKNQKTHWVTELLTEHRNPENHTQIIAAFYVLVTGSIFLIIMGNVIHQGILTALNVPFFDILQSLRTNIGDNIFLAITVLGSPPAMLISASLIFIWLIFNRCWRAAIHWLALVFAASWSIHVFKSLNYFPRPAGFIGKDITSSFPSGHTLLTMSLLGFLAVLINQEITTKRYRSIYLLVFLAASLVGISRLYLGAHWLTDVCAALFLGMTLVLLIAISYRRSHKHPLPIAKFIAVIITSFLLTWTVVGLITFKKIKQNHTMEWSMRSVSFIDWQKHINYPPLFRMNRFGKPTEALNIEWFGDLDTIRAELEKQGWKNQETIFSVVGMLRNISKADNNYYLPVLPQLYHNQPPSLLMTKPLSIMENKWLIVLHLWKSDTQIQKSTTPLWFGVVSYYQAPSKFITKVQRKNRFFLGATDELITYLKKYKVKTIYYSVSQQPSETQFLHWDGKSLLIY
jgi:membrane protein DedA with SNARE-associated domain/membrane-associated phospholipid phosphatase